MSRYLAFGDALRERQAAAEAVLVATGLFQSGDDETTLGNRQNGAKNDAFRSRTRRMTARTRPRLVSRERRFRQGQRFLESVDYWDFLNFDVFPEGLAPH
jgi:hypothetical protein